MFDRIQADLKTAMRSRDVLVTSVLRMLLSELNYKKIDAQRDLNDDDVLAVIQKEVKKRREAVESYTVGGRPDQAKQEQDELVVLQVYLPEQMNEDQLRNEIAVMVSNAPSREFGQVMRVVSPAFKGKADGSLVAKIVRELLV